MLIPRKEGDPMVQAVLSGRIVDVGVGVDVDADVGVSTDVDHLHCWGLWQSLQLLTCPQVLPPAPSLTFILI